MDSSIQEMLACLEQRKDVYLPSKFWETYSEKNLKQLECDGFENFEQTIALNYFLPPVAAFCKAARDLGFSRALATTTAQNHVLDFGRSRACRGGKRLESLRSPRVGISDRVLARVERVLMGFRLAVGEEALIVLEVEQ
jgi:hypothetical protein